MSKLFQRILAAGTAAVMLASIPLSSNAAAEKFTDVSPNKWYYTAVDYAVSEELFSGTSAVTFSPNEPMTRGMFVTVLGNKAEIDPAQYTGSSFSDVKTGKWYAPSVEWASGNGIVNGIGGGKFAPNTSVTREQMAVILYNYAKFTDCDLTVQAGLLEQFPDGNRVSKYAKYAMEWALTHKVINGSGSKLDPQGIASRAQVAQIFYNSRELLDNSGETPKPPAPSPSPSPSPGPDMPKIEITDEVRAKLKPNQDPEKILDYVLNGKHDDPTFSYDGTKAKWDPSLQTQANDVGTYRWGLWTKDENDMHSSSAIGNCFQQVLTYTASDKFCITAKDSDGCFRLYYHPSDKADSQKLQEVRAALQLPVSKKYDRELCYKESGWAGPITWDVYGGAKGVAEKIEYYLTEMHPCTTQYYLTEPEPGKFYN